MKTLVKIIAWIVAIFIVLLIIAAVVFKHTFNPNDYKQQIATAVSNKTGHSLKITGNIKLSVFPWLGVDISKVSFGNPKQFTGPTLASVGEAQVRIKMLPMIFGDFDVSKVVLKNTSINLITKANGSSNWKDLINTAKSKPKSKHHKSQPSKASSKQKPTSFNIGTIDIVNANVNLVNQQTHKNVHFNHFNLQSSNINFNGEKFSITSSFSLKQSQPLTDVNMNMSGTFNINSAQVSIANLNINGKIAAYKTKLAKPVPYALEIAQFSKSNSKTQINNLNVELGNFKATANITQTVKDISGDIKANNFSPAKLVTMLNMQQPLSGLAQMKSASFNATIRTSKGTTEVLPLQLNLNGNTVNGKLSYNSNKHFTSFSITANKLDIDSLMPNNPTKSTKSTKTKAAASDQKASTSSPIPVKLLRQYGWKGLINIKQLTIHGINASDLIIQTENNHGNITINPISANLYSANLYNGTLRSVTQLNASINPVQLHSNTNIKHVNLGQFAKAAAGKDVISGIANFNLAINSSGNSSKALINNLHGQGNFNIGQGEFLGFDLDSIVKQIQNYFTSHKGSKTAPKVKQGNTTDFTSMNADFNIKHGIIYNNNLALVTPRAQANGKGSINLPTSSINYVLSAGPKAINGKQAWYIPIEIKGPLAKPRVGLDMAALIQQFVQDAIGNAIKDAFGGSHSGSEHKSNGINKLFNGLFKH